MSLLPVVAVRDGAPRSRALIDAARDQRSVELAVYRHGLYARYQAETDQIDSQAAADVMQTALDEELDLLAHGLRRANGSAAKAELVARKVEMLSEINSRRIQRRFGR